MSKILLVEDDNNLREIYEARLLAEGYDIVSAQDGEEALVKAKQEKPDLIVSDVMMPRISGFEMLDILRNTEGLKHTKVIMLTALGQAEDQTRADSLGADRYLVKSQVTLEDIVKAAQELLSQQSAAPENTPPPANAPIIPETPSANQPAPASVAAAPTGSPVTPPVEKPTPAPAGAPVAPPQEPTATPASAPTAPVTVQTPSIPVVQPPAAAAATPTTAPVNPALPPTPIAPTPAASTAPSAQAPAPVVPAPSASAPVLKSTAPVDTPVAQTDTPQNTAATPVVSAAPQAPAGQNPPPASQPTVPAPATPAPSAAPAEQPKPPATPEVTEPAKVPEANAPKPAPEQPMASTDQADDKLIADAMKSLTASLGGDSEPAKTTAPDKEPSTAAEPTPPAKEEAPAATPEEAAPTAVPPAPESANTSIAAPTANAPQEPAPQTPSAETPSQPTSTSVEPDLDLTASQLPGVTGVSSQATPAVSAVPKAEQPAAAKEETLTHTAASTADEQAVMKQQIDDFIKQQDARQANQKPEASVAAATPPTIKDEAAAPAPESEMSASITPQPELNAIPEPDMPRPTLPSAAPVEPITVPAPTQATPETTPSKPTTFKPDAPSEPAPSTAAPETDESEPESVAIAHKKIIQPPVEPMTNQPDLSELLAREGMNFDDNPLPSGPVANGSSFAQPPHQPGHVISPGAQGVPAQPQATNSLNPDDPNNIAL